MPCLGGARPSATVDSSLIRFIKRQSLMAEHIFWHRHRSAVWVKGSGGNRSQHIYTIVYLPCCFWLDSMRRTPNIICNSVITANEFQGAVWFPRGGNLPYEIELKECIYEKLLHAGHAIEMSFPRSESTPASKHVYPSARCRFSSSLCLEALHSLRLFSCCAVCDSLPSSPTPTDPSIPCRIDVSSWCFESGDVQGCARM
jgi:hypothetical protein